MKMHKALSRAVAMTAVIALFMIVLSSVGSIAVASPVVVSIEAGPIWSQYDAQTKCPKVAATNGGTWNGQWRTTVMGRMSVCEVVISRPHHTTVEWIEAGPIWNQMDAESKCPKVAAAKGGTWNGQWRTTVMGQMSVCEVRFSR
jgi:rubredoxin